jgi:tRNA pseudouridine55 synthase
MNGIINFNKPVGITSCKAINHVKKAFKSKKAGHTGTLDPNANGVLPICLGKATQIVQFVIHLPKTYRGKMRLGIRTDTQDADGKIISESSNNKIDQEHLEKIFQKYEGAIEQIPPMFSAVRVNGKRLYTLARKGISIVRNPKKVFVYYLKLLDYENDLVTFEAKTSAGTYIRTLCDDIGNDLGCGAYLAELTRTSVGDIKIEDSISMEDIERSSLRNGLKDKVYSIDKVLSFFPSVKIKEQREKSLLAEKTITQESIEDISGESDAGEYFRIHNSSGKLLGIVSSLWNTASISSCHKQEICFKLKKLLV